MRVIIMQGVPGSGKSQYISKNLSHAKVFSADHYFMVSGEYKFDPLKLGEAHKLCLFKFVQELVKQQDDSVLVVDNTNTQLWEMAPYVQVAAAFGADVEVIRCVVSPDIAAARNTHGVPEKGVRAMHSRLEKPLPFWPCTYREVQTF